MTIVKCDRCGKELTEPDSRVVYIANAWDERTVRPDRYDLCVDCTDTLEVWINANRGKL